MTTFTKELALSLLYVLFLLFFSSTLLVGEQLSDLELSNKITMEATAPTDSWPLPPPGPAVLPNKTIVYIAEDLRNGGVLGVGTGVREAGTAVGWKILFLDIGSNEEKRENIFAEAYSLQPDGIILGGMDGGTNTRYLGQFVKANIPIIGWHSAPFPGPVPDTPIRVNVTTDSLEVARAAAHFVISYSAGTGSVIIFTDSRFAIALQKSDAMAEIIQSCKTCKVLEVRDLALNQVTQQMPEVTASLLKKYGDSWEYTLGINDLYFDHSIIPLVMAGKSPSGPPFNISAGDGSASAYLRIHNNSYQIATVPEPLLFHGWQLIDEMNRLLQDRPASGYVTPPHIVTQDNIWPRNENSNLFDPKNGYRKRYLSNWLSK